MGGKLKEGDIVETRDGKRGKVCAGPVVGEYLIEYDNEPMEWRYRIALKRVQTRAEHMSDKLARESAERVERRMRDDREREIAVRSRTPVFAAYLTQSTTLITTNASPISLARGTEVAAKVSENGTRVFIEYGGVEFILPESEFRRLFMSESERQRRLTSAIAAKTPNPAHRPSPPLEWFDVIASKDYRHGIKKGDMVEVARCDDAHGFVVKVGGNHITFFGGAFIEYFERYDIDDYARELSEVKQYEVDAALKGIYEGGNYVGAELYGYPPEEEREASRIAELEAQIEELKRQKNDADYGVVAECYLWEIEYEVPHKWGKGKSERIAEILTTQQNMAEAGIAAEATAKDDGLDAVVTSLKYKRRIFRTK